MEPEVPWSLEAVVAETRAEVRGLRSDVDGLKSDMRREFTDVRSEFRNDIAELRHDIRRLDDRFFQLLLIQVGTLLAALGSVATALLT